MEDKEHLKEFTVGSLPTLFYIPNFISESEQTQLLHHIYEVPIPKWKTLKNRRLQNRGGVVHEKGLLPQDLPPWLTAITQRITKQTGLFPSPINHVLINEYLPEQGIMPHQDGPAYFPVVAIISLGSPVVMNFTPHPRLRDCANETINTTTDSRSEKGVVEIEINKKSLLIFKDMAYSDYLHGIEDTNIHSLDKVINDLEVLEDEGEMHSSYSEESVETEVAKQPRSIHRTATRVSLTCRLVQKVHKNLFKF